MAHGVRRRGFEPGCFFVFLQMFSILFLFPRVRKTRIIPFSFYATPPRIEARRIEKNSGIMGSSQVVVRLVESRCNSGAFDFRPAVHSIKHGGADSATSPDPATSDGQYIVPGPVQVLAYSSCPNIVSCLRQKNSESVRNTRCAQFSCKSDSWRSYLIHD